MASKPGHGLGGGNRFFLNSLKKTWSPDETNRHRPPEALHQSSSGFGIPLPYKLKDRDTLSSGAILETACQRVNGCDEVESIRSEPLHQVGYNGIDVVVRPGDVAGFSFYAGPNDLV